MNASRAQDRARSATLERILVTLIILISVGLALAWALVVPMFQEPDEDQHADYAFAIYSAGHLIGAREGAPTVDSNPSVRYLLNASGFRYMRYNVVGRVPTDYGSPDFYRRVDAGAPKIDKDYIERSREVPNLVSAYPFLYYGLDALAIALGAAVTKGSLTAEFFFARGLSVALLPISLIFTYLTLCELRVAYWRRLAILAIIAWFPLTTWVSAYIQPDNLAFTAVAAALYYTIRLRSAPENRLFALALSLVLGVMWLTKIQYFAAVAPAALLCVIFSSAQAARSFRFRAVVGVGLLAPTIVAILLTHFISFSASSSVSGFAGAFGAGLADARGGGFGGMASYVGRELIAAYENAFGIGTGVYTYWIDFTWLNTPIIQNPWGSNLPIGYTIVLFSTVISVLASVRVISVLRRLAIVGLKYSAAAATRLLFSNVVLNSYIGFVAIIAAIFVLSDGTLAQYGRYWLPFELAAVLCAVSYVPKVLPRRFRAPLSNFMTVILLLYSTTAAIAGPTTLQARFYKPALQPDRTTESIAAIDRVDGSLVPVPVIIKGTVTVPAGKDVVIGGWAIDSRAGQPAKRVDLVADGDLVFPTEYGLPSCNRLLEIAFADPQLFNCGFRANLDAQKLGPGRHVLSLLIYEQNRDEPYPSSNKLNIDIVSPNVDGK